MSSLKADFNELLRRIGQGREFAHASFEPIYYLVFHPSQILEVKRQTPAWVAKLRNDGWEVTVFSVAWHVTDILAKAPLRKLWLTADAKNPLDWTKTNQSLANALVKADALQSRLEAVLTGLAGSEHSIVLVTDLEALHPYLRIGAIEAQLQGKFHVPTVFLYPGVRTGKTRLKFLGFYPEDGNYRSDHVGG
ncbi:BREX protein BrxB domain-containing protein [uncultured Thiodictyon sp.]|uniref:BREX protein BrxB domain-containing protein n=1 Tax=uncultured Thiodictyon sp. TaxID=1846217 RepID=UPI0025E188E5|nr:BREX protein BrxB domain-containing protein [uncultured Thiodictyon sp.]